MIEEGIPIKTCVHSEVLRSSAPIFVMGTSFRSGTNYLMNLVCLHSDCVSPGPIWEDFILQHADMLSTYSELTHRYWNPDWGVEGGIGTSEVMMEHLGRGLISFLNLQLMTKNQKEDRVELAESKSILVTKTPSTLNIDLFFKLFPDSYLLIIVRDGRGVTESRVKSSRKSYEIAIREWNRAAKNLLAFDDATQKEKYRYRIVQYESLVQDPISAMKGILQFLELDIDRYNFNGINSLPVFGSSELSQQSEVHWDGCEREPNFDPINRWSKWNRELHARFDWLAGESQIRLGYDCVGVSKNARFYLKNVILDFYWGPVWFIFRNLRYLNYRTKWRFLKIGTKANGAR